MEESSFALSGQVRKALEKFRVGSVPYLNAAPLTEGIADRLIYDVPSRLALRFAGGELDAALIPIYEAIALRDATVADGIAIACDGPVYSVVVAYRGALHEVDSIALDPDSRTSSHLVQCLFSEFREGSVRFTDQAADPDQARLIIGDPAIAFRERHAGGGWNILDLGADWRQWTGLPFVFACWVFRPGFAQADVLAGLLRQVKAHGLAHIPQIASRTSDPDFSREYLTRHVRFDLNAPEREAIEKFASLLSRHALVDASRELRIRYV